MQGILLDTSFILPSLGIDPGEKVIRGLERVSSLGVQVWCSRFSMMEALWVVARLAGKRGLDEESFKYGLNSILKGGTYCMAEEDAEVYVGGLRLYSLGHRDMIDNLLYSTSKTLGLRFLTVDDKLRAFIQSQGLRDTLVFPTEL